MTAPDNANIFLKPELEKLKVEAERASDKLEKQLAVEVNGALQNRKVFDVVIDFFGFKRSQQHLDFLRDKKESKGMS